MQHVPCPLSIFDDFAFITRKWKGISTLIKFSFFLRSSKKEEKKYLQTCKNFSKSSKGLKFIHHAQSIG
jgi:hypothetical protein